MHLIMMLHIVPQTTHIRNDSLAALIWHAMVELQWVKIWYTWKCVLITTNTAALCPNWHSVLASVSLSFSERSFSTTISICSESTVLCNSRTGKIRWAEEERHNVVVPVCRACNFAIALYTAHTRHRALFSICAPCMYLLDLDCKRSITEIKVKVSLFGKLHSILWFNFLFTHLSPPFIINPRQAFKSVTNRAVREAWKETKTVIEIDSFLRIKCWQMGAPLLLCKNNNKKDPSLLLVCVLHQMMQETRSEVIPQEVRQYNL